MIIKNAKIVTLNEVIDNGYLIIEDGIIQDVKKGECNLSCAYDAEGKIVFPGFIDIHTHGSLGIDFMDANPKEIKEIADAFYKEGITSFLLTTLTSDKDSLIKVARNVKEAVKITPSLVGVHLEGPYISAKYKGAQNELYIRDPDVCEIDELIKESENNIKYISLAPEKENSMPFIKEMVKRGIIVSAGHTDASFKTIEEAIKCGLTNTTHTHNAMSPHHHRNPGVVSASMYFDELYTEMIMDLIHVSSDAIKTFYKIVGPDRFMIITDSLSAKHSKKDKITLFGLPCIRKDGALYLESGPLAGSLLLFDQGLRNLKKVTDCSLIDLMKASSYNQSKSLKLNDRGLIEKGRIADLVFMDDKLNIKEVYKLGRRVY